jgi:hypothetical protein
MSDPVTGAAMQRGTTHPAQPLAAGHAPAEAPRLVAAHEYLLNPVGVRQ